MSRRSLQPEPDCEECEALAREMLEARDADRAELRRRLLDAARASGRTPLAMRDAWLKSVATMGEEEMGTVGRAFSARSEAVRRRQTAHTLETGHSNSQRLWQMMMGYRGPR